LGTPYCHQASVKGVGTDCLGLLRGVWRATIGNEPQTIPTYSQDWSEPQRKEVLLEAARLYLVEKPLSDMAQGDVLLFRMRTDRVAKHLGIVSSVGLEARFVHAYSGHGVVESPLSLPWKRRVAHCFQFPKRT
jgi:NlpC/P60 family putative phage cell wall peptidase